MKAITTKSHGPTNHKPSRYSATDREGQRVMIDADTDLDYRDNHARAALALCKKMGWNGHNEKMIGGSVKDAFVWVFPCEHLELDLDAESIGGKPIEAK